MDPFPNSPDTCPSCGAKIRKRYSAGGFDFHGCTAYPACRWTGRTPTTDTTKPTAPPFLRGPVSQ